MGDSIIEGYRPCQDAVGVEAPVPTPEKWSCSRDQERFHGEFATWWEAVLDALSHEQDVSVGVYVGRCEPPTPPEGFRLADTLIEHIQIQDEYCGEWGENWPDATKAQMDELEAALEQALAAWLDKHGLRPTFYTVPESEFRTKDEALAALFGAKGIVDGR